MKNNSKNISNVLQNSEIYLSKYTLTLLLIIIICVILLNITNPRPPHTSSTSSTLFNKTINNTKSFNLTLPSLCIITRIYWAQISYFPVFALALYYNDLDNIRIYVVNTDKQTNIQQLKQTIQFINELILHPNFITLLDLDTPPIGNNFGYEMTDRALDYFYNQHRNSSFQCQYVTFTNGDNFYSRNFAKKILPHMKNGKDIIGWGFVSHHYKPHYKESINNTKKSVPEVIDDGTEKCTPVELRAGYADLGAVAYRLSFLQQHKLYFRKPFSGYSFGSDGYFITEAAKRTTKSIILKQTLLVHQ